MCQTTCGLRKSPHLHLSCVLDPGIPFRLVSVCGVSSLPLPPTKSTNTQNHRNTRQRPLTLSTPPTTSPLRGRDEVAACLEATLPMADGRGRSGRARDGYVPGFRPKG